VVRPLLLPVVRGPGEQYTGPKAVVLRVKATSKRVFDVLAGALLGSGARRSLTVSLLGAFALGIVTTLPATPSQVHLASVPAAGGAWLSRLNTWRTSTGLSTLTENTTWSQGDYDHALYMVRNDLVTHYETTGVPYYSVAGDTAARNGNIQVSSTTSSTDDQAIDWWMEAPFHAMAMMDPRLTSTGFGSYRLVKSGWQEGATLDTSRGRSSSGGTYPVYFPGNGTTEPLTTYTGGESPNPLQACSGYTAPTGLPVFIEVGANVATTVGAVHSFTGNGVALSHCVIDSNNAALSTYLTYRGGVILVPKAPLVAGVKYVVALTVNDKPYTWSFTVGPFTLCSAVSATATPLSPSSSGAPVAFTGNALGCPNPLYEYWTLAPSSSTWKLAQPYSASAAFNWDTTGLAAGTYHISVWAHDSSNTGINSNGLGRYDSFGTSTYALTVPGTCASVTAAATPPSPSAPGTAVAITGAALGCANPFYQFWLLAPGSTIWTVALAYSSTATFNWATTGLAPGLYRLSVWARDAASTGTSTNTLGSYDAFVGATYMIGAPCTSVTMTASPAASAVRGTPVTFTAVALGCPNPLYEFWALAPSSITWTAVQGYTTTAAFTWDTTGKVAGTYHVSVWVRDAASPGTNTNSLGRYDTFAPIVYTLK
jgi:Cysteine-rich secretory protein family